MNQRARLSRVTTISFDGDATLWDFEKVMRSSLGHTLTELRRAVPGERTAALSVEEMIAIRDRVAAELKGSGADLGQVRLQAFRRTVEHVGLRDEGLARRLNRVYRTHRFAEVEPYPDVIPALDALAGRFSLGLVSNGNTRPEYCGLERYFSFVIFSRDHAAQKPDPRLFEVALAQAGCSPAELLHVGDSLADDVQGAQGAGIMSTWLNRQAAENTTGIEPDIEIASLAQLPGLWRSA